MKITRAQLRQIIKESLKESEQMGLDFRPADERELDAAMESWDEWKQVQIDREVPIHNDPLPYLLVKWMASRGKNSGRKYAHLLPAIAAEFEFDKGDVMDGIKKYGTKSMMSLEINEQGSYGSRRGGYGPVTVRDIERMLPPGVMREYPGSARILQRRALDAGMSKNELEDKVKAARIKDRDHPRQFFKRLGFKYD